MTWPAALARALLLGAMISSGCVVDDLVGQKEPVVVEGCEIDDFDDPTSRGDLTPMSDPDRFRAEGYICPVGDEDWYALTVPDDHGIVGVSLTLTGPISPVQPTFEIDHCDNDCLVLAPEDPRTCCDPVAVANAADLGPGHVEFYCLEPGPYSLVVHDVGDDNADGTVPRGKYVAEVLTLSERDPNEENDTPDDAARLHDGGDQTWFAEGQVSCQGDQDWFVLDSSDGADLAVGNVLVVRLDITLPVSYQPRLRILDADNEQLGLEQNLNAALSETHLEWSGTIESTGAYYFVVEDDDLLEADPQTYELTVAITAE